MFGNIYTDDAKKVLNKICPTCDRRMNEFMPHLEGQDREPICNTCKVYWSIVGDGAMANKDLIQEKNRRLRFFRDDTEFGI